MASKNTQKILIIVGVVFLALLLVCGGGGYAFWRVIRAATEASEKAVDKFNADYNKKDYQAMYNALSPNLQREVTLEKLTEMVDGLHNQNGLFVSNSGNGWNVKSANGTTRIELTYSVKYAKTNGSQEFVLEEINGKPLIIGFHINAN